MAIVTATSSTNAIKEYQENPGLSAAIRAYAAGLG
jgi:hypothetical protein